MSQADGKNKLQRVEFDLAGKSYKFALNPEEYYQEEPSRSTVTQTKGGAWVDDFGAGLPTITIKGTTGLKKGGFEKFKELRDLIRAYYKKGKFGAEMTEAQELTFHNHTDGESWIVHIDPSGFKLSRSKQSPLLYNYEIKMICLRNAKDPHPNNNMTVTGDNTDAVDVLTSEQATNSFTNSNSNSSGALFTPEQSAAISNANKENNKKINEIKMKELEGLNYTQAAGSVDVSNNYVSNAKQVSNQQRTMMAADLSFFGNTLLESLSTEFNPKLSELAVSTHKDITIGKRRSFTFNPKDGGFNLRVYDFLNSYVGNDIKVVVSAVVIELLGIAFYGFTNDGFTLVFTKVDANRLINNISYVIDTLSDLDKPPWKLINDFRGYQRIIMFISNCGIYDTTVKEELSQIKNAQRVGGNNE